MIACVVCYRLFRLCGLRPQGLPGYWLARVQSQISSFTFDSSPAPTLATWMVARKLLENWLWWLLIDTVSLALYLDRGLYPTALLFLVYLVIVVFGFIRWNRHYREQHAAAPLAAHAG